MGRTLAVTARDAARAARPIPGVDYLVCEWDVAALLPLALVEGQLRSIDLSKYERLILPGGVNFDVRELERRVGVPCFRGPTHIGDLPWVIERGLALSKDVPAEKLHERAMAEEAARIVADAERKGRVWGRLRIGGMARVIGEIVDAPRMDDEEVAARAEYFKQEGASVIDIGMIANEDNSGEVARLVEAARRSGLPVSVDTMHEREMLAAADAGADLLLSLTLDTLELAPSLGMPCVIIPGKNGRIAKGVWEKVGWLEEAGQKLRKMGFERYIADPILEPVGAGFADSLLAYYHFRHRNPDVPLLMGVGNVVELFDADSVGMNALLAGFGSEIGVEFLFAPEKSPKARGSVRELAAAARLLCVARERGSMPKDLGFSVLALKEKRERPGVAIPADEVVEAKAGEPRYDRGRFKIFLTDRINVVWEEGGKRILFAGSNASDVGMAIARDERVKISTEHAVYLGRELAKAELCLLLHKSYVQDEPMEWGIYAAQRMDEGVRKD
ncbi:MAG: dihydropteroate synthase-like protein [Candidatus Micrarchaeia archaeon]